MIKNLQLSLEDIAGAEYISKVCKASAALGIGSEAELRKIAGKKVDFYPDGLQKKLDDLVR